MVYLLEAVERDWNPGAGVLGELLTKQVQGVALQQSDIPAEMALGGRFELPDICDPADGGFRFVSGRGRAVLEELVPSCVAFFPLNLKVPSRMRPAKAYFFFEVLSRAQLIDWEKSPTRVVRASDGRETRTLKGRLTDLKFKAATPETPPIWREGDVDRPAVQFFYNKVDVFVRDDVWDLLNVRLPNQLVATKLA
jgi:hypothetical protein